MSEYHALGFLNAQFREINRQLQSSHQLPLAECLACKSLVGLLSNLEVRKEVVRVAELVLNSMTHSTFDPDELRQDVDRIAATCAAELSILPRPPETDSAIDYSAASCEDVFTWLGERKDYKPSNPPPPQGLQKDILLAFGEAIEMKLAEIKENVCAYAKTETNPGSVDNEMSKMIAKGYLIRLDRGWYRRLVDHEGKTL
ncbi:MAG: hypothetical protein KDB27_21595 [Planctomycetales bacterium]|nr:hypothetical protein [Planctomycetales bacterium]